MKPIRDSHPKSDSDLVAVWIEKYLVHMQDRPGDPPRPVDNMLLCETVLSSPGDGYEVVLTRGATGDGERVTSFVPEAPLVFINEMLLNRKARSFASRDELEEAFPAGEYTFTALDASGTHALTVNLGGESGETEVPSVPTIDLLQSGGRVTGEVDSSLPLRIEWDSFVCEGSSPSSSPGWFAQNAIFLLLDNARGEMVYSSGVVPPYAELTPDSTWITIPADRLEPGMDYTVFLSFINYRDTDSAERADGTRLEAASVNSIAVELPFSTGGEAAAGRSRPPRPVRANYRWPGVRASEAEPLPWPVDSSGLHIDERPILPPSVPAGSEGGQR